MEQEIVIYRNKLLNKRTIESSGRVINHYSISEVNMKVKHFILSYYSPKDIPNNKIFVV